MTTEKYSHILIHHAILSGKHLIGKGFIFQHDSDPKHFVKTYLDRKTHYGSLSKACTEPRLQHY